MSTPFRVWTAGSPASPPARPTPAMQRVAAFAAGGGWAGLRTGRTSLFGRSICAAAAAAPAVAGAGAAAAAATTSRRWVAVASGGSPPPGGALPQPASTVAGGVPPPGGRLPPPPPSSTASTGASPWAPLPPTLHPRIAVVGGGFGGLYTALKLAALPWSRLQRPTITLIDASPRFVFLPMLYEAAVGTAAGWEVAPRYADLLADEPLITYLQATATEVDATAGTVTVVPAGGVGAPVALPYDRLVVAVGGRPTQPDIPGLKEHGLPLHSYEAAVAVKQALVSAVAAGRRRRVPAAVVVVGGGYSGVEMASTVADRYGADVTVSLVTTSDGIMPDAAAASRAAGAAALTAGGVTLVPRTRVAALTDETVTLVSATGPPAGAPERTAPADVVVWTAGAVPATAGLPGVSGGTPLVGGKVAVDECLRVPSAAGVYALGDAAATTGGDAPTAAAAVQQAEVAGWNVWAGLTGQAPLAYAQVYLGEMLTLGGGAASVATPFGLSLDGAPAALVRRAAYLARMPTAGHRRRVAASWGSAALLSAVQGLTGWGEAAPDGGRRDSVAPVE